jgi:uncharacterized protein YceK
MKNILVLLSVLLLSGCASAGMNVSCGHIIGSGTYATAQGNGAGTLCHAGCVGFNCPKPDYAALINLTSAYIQSSSAVTTTVPITVAVVPTAK